MKTRIKRVVTVDSMSAHISAVRSTHAQAFLERHPGVMDKILRHVYAAGAFGRDVVAVVREDSHGISFAPRHAVLAMATMSGSTELAELTQHPFPPDRVLCLVQCIDARDFHTMLGYLESTVPPKPPGAPS